MVLVTFSHNFIITIDNTYRLITTLIYKQSFFWFGSVSVTVAALSVLMKMLKNGNYCNFCEDAQGCDGHGHASESEERLYRFNQKFNFKFSNFWVCLNSKLWDFFWLFNIKDYFVEKGYLTVLKLSKNSNKFLKKQFFVSWKSNSFLIFK